MRLRALALIIPCAALASWAAVSLLTRTLVTGKEITPAGSYREIGGFPVRTLASPDGRWVAVLSSGDPQFVDIVSAKDGKAAHRISFEGQFGTSNREKGAYFGLAWSGTKLWVSQGDNGVVSGWRIANDGSATAEGELKNPNFAFAPQINNGTAGLAASSDGSFVLAVNNMTAKLRGFEGSLSILDTATGVRTGRIETPGFPLDAALLTRGSQADRKAYVSSERDGVVYVVDVPGRRMMKTLHTGDNPTHLLLNRRQTRLYVANSSSDTISVIDTLEDRVVQTFLVRPVELRGLPGATPLGMALNADETRLYAACADLNAIAVIDLRQGRLAGFIPTGWYPTDVACSGGMLHAAVAKGLGGRVPSLGDPPRRQVKGHLALIDEPGSDQLIAGAMAVAKNNRAGDLERLKREAKTYNPGIEHVIYIVKENRTYDQMFGDMPQGVGDPNLHLYGDDVIPNQRALARRFGLWDNFYCNAEMSADGWSWATAGIASEYVQRNAQYEYSGRERNYDYEGQSNGSPSDARGERNANDPPGGYIWDNARKHGVSLRNYGLYMAQGVPIPGSDGRPIAEDNQPAMKALIGVTNTDYRMYNLDYPDSDLYDAYGHTYPRREPPFGRFKSKSRFEEWRREYRELIALGTVPQLTILRFGNDHTNGTTPGSPSPASMIADNDYAVGQLVEEVTKGPLWAKTAIVIVEDDAQGGYDSVDGHRSICLVISPFTPRGRVHSQFANTDSALRTVEVLMGIESSNHYMATAEPLKAFGKTRVNREAYSAILPAEAVAKAVNTEASYRAADSARLFRTDREESAPDRELADILWGDRFGAEAPRPR